MSGAQPQTRAAQLRDAFDDAFSEAPSVVAVALVELLAIRIGGDRYAIRLSECAGLHLDRKVTPLPTSVPGLLGIAGFRGSLVPVYDLRVSLGHPRRTDAPRWLVSVSGSDKGVGVVALAFDVFDAQLRVPPGAIIADLAPPVRPNEGDARHPHAAHTDGVVHLPDGARRVLRLPSVLEAIHARAGRQRQGA